ncbi:MAG: Ig-like domain-containing protein [Anaerolineales bacterium]
MLSRNRFGALLIVLLIAALSCSLPGLVSSGPSASPAATVDKSAPAVEPPTPPSLPPSLLSTEPAAGELANPDQALIFYFDQALERPSVESGFRIEPDVEGAMDWLDDRTLRFTPSQPLALAGHYRVSIDPLTSAQGLTSDLATGADFQTVPYLEVTQVQPSPASRQISTTSDIRIAFNQPVVPLELSGDLPSPIRFDPPIQGSGEWVGTSLYVFHPAPTIPAGRSISARIDPSLTTVGGARLDQPFEWSFSTGTPHLTQSEPADGQTRIALDPEINLTFNQPISRASLEQNLVVRDQDFQPIDGTIVWNDDSSQAVFTPNQRLDYFTHYFVNFDGTTGPAGTPLEGATSFTFYTAATPEVLTAFPGANILLGVFETPSVVFNAPMDQASLLRNLSVQPDVDGFGGSWNAENRRLSIHGQFEADRRYTITLAGSAQDPFGTPLGDSYSYQFQVGDYPARLDFTRYNDVLTFSTGRSTDVEIQARNISRVDLELYELPLETYFSAAQNSYEVLYGEGQIGTLRRRWSVEVPANRNANQSLRMPLGGADGLQSGTYMLRISSPDVDLPSRGRFIIVRGTELVIKSSSEQTLMWATDLETAAGLADFTLRLVDSAGTELSAPGHGQDGIAQLPPVEGAIPYDPLYVVHGQPGDPDFGITNWLWTDGIQPYQFGVSSRTSTPSQEDYLYTDRPLYQPGQTVDFRGVLRGRRQDRYVLPEESSVEVTIADPSGQTLDTRELLLSEYGSFNGSFELPDEAALGNYLISTAGGSVWFKVATYRKPNFSIDVTASHEDRILGQPLSATITADYFFGSPVAGQEVTWRAYGSAYFPPDLPIGLSYGYDGSFGSGSGGAYLADGAGVTDANGQLTIDVPTDMEQPRPLDLTIEATISQRGDLPVSGRTSVRLHPAALYLSLLPTEYSIRVGDTSPVRLHAVDIHGNPVSGQHATIQVFRLTWQQVVADNGSIEWQSQETPVNRDKVSTGDDGSVLVSFVPQRAGTYRVEAQSEDAAGRPVEGSTSLWVVGEAGGVWRQASANQITLVPDRESYQPGNTAQVLVPSPYDRTAEALVTVERDTILHYQLLEIPPEGRLLSFELGQQDAPNVYVSVTLLKPSGEDGPAHLSAGLAELAVSPAAEKLAVELTPDRSQAQPGDVVTYQLQAHDANGDPVQAEFSLSMVDAALLSLAEPNSLAPFDALWGERRLSVRTAASLALSGEQHNELNEAGGLGGGGGDAESNQVRENFKDTAYWNPSVVTDGQGRAEIEVRLPDNLTTWQAEARGVTIDTRAGSAIDRLIVSKPLLIQPVTPRFFTAGDRSQVAALVHNNTDQAIAVDVSLQATGASVNQPGSTTIRVPAGGSQRVSWDLSIGRVDGIGMSFSANGGGMQDSSKPTIGSARDGLIPVLRYTAPATAATSGWLPDESSLTESVSTPTRIDTAQGQLTLSLEPGAAGMILDGLKTLREAPYESTETIASRLAASAAALRLIEATQLESITSQTDLNGQIERDLRTLQERQSNLGGWAWWPGGSDSPYLTAHVLHALHRAEAVGAQPDPQMRSRAIQTMQATANTSAAVDPEGLAEQAYVLSVLTQTLSADPTLLVELARRQDHMPTSGLALTIDSLARIFPTHSALDSLTAELESRAVLSATGTHWDRDVDSYRSFEGAISNTAHAVQALLRVSPESPSIQGALRWLASARDQEGGWRTSYGTAWTVEALADWAEATQSWTSDFDYRARLNGQVKAEGSFDPSGLPSPVQVSIPMEELATGVPNALSIERGAGAGTLAYSAHLTAYQPTEDVPASNHGLSIERRTYLDDGSCDFDKNPCETAETLRAGDDLLVQLTMVVPADSYRVAAVDRYPAGAEPIDPGLATSAYRPGPSAPRFDFGWLGWYFSQIEIRDDRIYLFADYLPAGTYSYVYRLHASFAGTYRVLPARSWLVYFPQVYGQTAGQLLSIGAAGQP